MPTLAAARLQLWALVLSAYNYDIVYNPTQEHANADRLSRLPVATRSTEEESVGLEGISVFNTGQVCNCYRQGCLFEECNSARLGAESRFQIHARRMAEECSR